MSARGDTSTAAGGVALLAALALPPVAAALESSMTGHMVVQLPLLALGGGLIARGVAGAQGRPVAGYNAGGGAGLLLATFALACWMLPRSLDAALADVAVETAKFVLLPLLVGAPLALSWPLAGPLVRGLAWAHLIAMLATLGWVYQAAPARLCLGYRLDQQETLGWAMLIAAAMVATALAVRAFRGPAARTDTTVAGRRRRSTCQFHFKTTKTGPDRPRFHN